MYIKYRSRPYMPESLIKLREIYSNGRGQYFRRNASMRNHGYVLRDISRPYQPDRLSTGLLLNYIKYNIAEPVGTYDVY